MESRRKRNKPEPQLDEELPSSQNENRDPGKKKARQNYNERFDNASFKGERRTAKSEIQTAVETWEAEKQNSPSNKL